MKKLISKLLSGTLALMFVGQIMIYGDGSSQGIAHAETIQQIKNDIQLSKMQTNFHRNLTRQLKDLEK